MEVPSVGEQVLRSAGPVMDSFRLTSDAEDAPFSASIAKLGERSLGKQLAGAVPLQEEKMNADEALTHLRLKIAMGMRGGSHGLMRSWVLFRKRSGSSTDGINLAEFQQGLRSYGLPLAPRVSEELYSRLIQNSKDALIHIAEFIDGVMGRWKTEVNLGAPRPIARKHVVDPKNLIKQPKLTQRRHSVVLSDVNDLSLTLDQALLQLRRSITSRLKSGPNGLMRCWIEFRQRSGSTKMGITCSEFQRGLLAYGIRLKPDLVAELHAKMDTDGNGHIHITEFVDLVMGRWKTDTNTLAGFGESSIEADAGAAAYLKRQTAREHLLTKDGVDPLLTADDALLRLRKAITQRLRSGPNGLMRCWIEFRLRAGSSKEGITFDEFKHGLKCYGIPLTQDRTRELFDRMALTTKNIHVDKFVDVVMGRWCPSTNSVSGNLGGNRQDEHTALLYFEEGHTERRKMQEKFATASREALDLDLGQLLQLLRAKIAQRMPGGGHNIQRAWKTFRNAGGGTHEGLTRKNLQTALQYLGLPAPTAILNQLFVKLDQQSTGLVNEPAFARIVMHGNHRTSISVVEPKLQPPDEPAPSKNTLLSSPINMRKQGLVKTPPSSDENRAPSAPSYGLFEKTDDVEFELPVPAAALKKVRMRPVSVYGMRRPSANADDVVAPKTVMTNSNSLPFQSRPRTAGPGAAIFKSRLLPCDDQPARRRPPTSGQQRRNSAMIKSKSQAELRAVRDLFIANSRK